MDKGKSSFATLGVAIESAWAGQSLYLTGTSFATPIAAGIAANILEFARRKMALSDDKWEQLASYQGMRCAFKLLSVQGYHHKYVSLGNLKQLNLTTSEKFAEAIREAINFG